MKRKQNLMHNCYKKVWMSVKQQTEESNMSVVVSDRGQLWRSSHLSELKLEAVTMTSSVFCTSTGIFRQPGDFNNLCNNWSVSADKHTETWIKNDVKYHTASQRLMDFRWWKTFSTSSFVPDDTTSPSTVMVNLIPTPLAQHEKTTAAA